MKRVWALDVLEYPRCHGPMRLLAAIHPPDATRTHAGMSGVAFPRAPPLLAPSREKFSSMHAKMRDRGDVCLRTATAIRNAQSLLESTASRPLKLCATCLEFLCHPGGHSARRGEVDITPYT